MDSSRQLAAHTHGLVMSSRHNLVYAFDLGMDVIFSYKRPGCNMSLTAGKAARATALAKSLVT